MKPTALVAITLTLLAVSGAAAQRVEPFMNPPATIELDSEDPMMLGRGTALDRLAQLAPAREAALDDLRSLLAWNAAGRKPMRNGFIRPLLLEARVQLPVDRSAPQVLGTLFERLDGSIGWGGRFEVADAFQLRLHLQRVSLPEGAKLWVFGDSGDRVGPFGSELLGPDSDLWTPSVAGPAINLEVSVPRTSTTKATEFLISELLELVDPRFQLDEPGESQLADRTNLSCFVDGTCIGSSTLDVIDLYRAAVGQMTFVKNGAGYVCTGGLIADYPFSGTPYFLTAHHCLSTQSVASTLEITWDYKTPSCLGTIPNLATLPKSNGSTLLATGNQTDFTFLRLNSLPANRRFLGWDARTSVTPSATPLHRLSHPAPDGLLLPQIYSRSEVTADNLCGSGTGPQGQPLSDSTKFLSSVARQGSPFGGSSGAPVILQGGYIVGQLYGACGSGVDEPCLASPSSWRTVDGRLSATYPAIAQWIYPTPSNTNPCVRSAATACLLGGRFEVKVQWTTSTGTGAAQVMNFGAERTESNESVFFYFFNPANFEMGVKVLDGCGLGGNFWIFLSGLTNQGYTVTVRDTQTGRVKTYSNPLGTYPTTVGDTSALPCN